MAGPITQNFITQRGNRVLSSPISGFRENVTLWVAIREDISFLSVARYPEQDYNAFTYGYVEKPEDWKESVPDVDFPPGYDPSQVEYISANTQAASALGTILALIPITTGVFLLGVGVTAAPTAAVTTGASGTIFTAEASAAIDAAIASGRGITVAELALLNSGITNFTPSILVTNILSDLFPNNPDVSRKLKFTLIFQFAKHITEFGDIIIPLASYHAPSEYTASGIYLDYIVQGGPLTLNISPFGELTLNTGTGRIFLDNQEALINQNQEIYLNIESAPNQGFFNFNIYGRFYETP